MEIGLNKNVAKPLDLLERVMESIDLLYLSL